MVVKFLVSALSVLAQESDCSLEFAQEDFPEKIVYEVFDEFKIPARDWVELNRNLQHLTQEIPHRIQRKAQALDRNPFNEPKQRAVISRLYRQSTQEVLKETLNDYGISNERDIQDMYEAIQDRKAQHIWDCYYRKS